MASEARAFAPANISCIFRIHIHKNPRWAGSCGVGFTLNKGVIVNVKKAKKTEVLFNNRKINFPAVRDAVNKLTREKVNVNIKSKLPLGCGFGLSGACALATAYALNKLLNLKKSKRELAIIAHTAEAENKTGLGDVVNQYYGGFCVKLKPSPYFVVKKLPIKNVDLYCKCFSRLPTKSVIANLKIRNRINNAASIALIKIKKLMAQKNNIKFGDVIKISKEFASNSGLLMDKRVMQTIKSIEQNGGNASMIMLGNSVFSDKPFKGCIKLKISNKGAHLL